MKQYIKFAILLSVIFQQAANATCEKSDVAKTAKEIFTNHRDFFSVDPVTIKSLLAPELFAVLADEYSCTSQGELCAIEADPWLDAQDGDIAEPIRFTVTNQGALTASVEMNYLFVLSETQKENKTVTLQLKKEQSDSCWLLDDFVTPQNKSFKKIVKQWHSR